MTPIVMRFLDLFSIFAIVQIVLGHAIPGIGSIGKQIASRENKDNLMQTIYDSLTIEETDFIESHLKNLTSVKGDKCAQCKNRIRYGQSLLKNQPDKQHLISLTLFKYCILQNEGKESKCDNVDFFVTTTEDSSELELGEFNSGLHGNKGINFFDNDFIQVLKLFNTSSEIDLEYYCYFKNSKACDLPDLPDIDSLYNFDAKWPAKEAKHHTEPLYSNGNKDRFNVLHISDFHLQSRYQVGSESNCTAGICCLPESYNADLKGKYSNFTDTYYKLEPSLKAKQEIEYSFYPYAHYDNNTYIKGDYYDFPKYRGYNYNNLPATSFGAYKCDSPELLLNNSLTSISKSHLENKFEFAIFTGDLVDHDPLHCDAETTKYEEIQNFKLMKHYLDKIPVYPSLGNHDTFPYAQLSPMKYNYNNLYQWNVDLMSDLWISNGWLPKNQSSFMKSHYSGFSTVTDRGLKVIALNSNCYYPSNNWAYINLLEEPDLFGQWQFLIDELVESESQNQRVWIMAHVPSSSDALPIQSQIFAKIVERFSPYTIANIFYGHTHRDQFHIYYSSNSSDTKEIEDVVNMSWVSQSITPLTENNPSWRYYEVEDESFNIMDSYNYYTQLNETFTNNGEEPDWTFEYSARKSFDPNNDWPTSSPLNGTFWHKYVLENLKNQSDVEFNQYYIDLQYRMSPYVPKCANGTELSKDCYLENWCVVSTYTSQQFIDCKAKANKR